MKLRYGLFCIWLVAVLTIYAAIEECVSPFGTRKDVGGHVSIVLVGKNESDAKSLFSFGFGGCTGIVGYFKYRNGSQVGFLTHFSPLSTKQELEKLVELSQTFANLKRISPIERSKIIIMHPFNDKDERYLKTRNTRRPYLVPFNQKAINRLYQVFTEKFNVPKSSIEVSLYPHDDDVWRKKVNQFAPKGIFKGKPVSKELEIYIHPNPHNSYASMISKKYKKHFFNPTNVPFDFEGLLKGLELHKN